MLATSHPCILEVHYDAFAGGVGHVLGQNAVHASQHLITMYLQEVLAISWPGHNACISTADYHAPAGSVGHVLVRT